jgi:protoporphyrin/coproporphyrin ferrochelatase
MNSKVERTAVVLVNLGTPENPTKRKVRQFLSEFLNDPLVIDLPYIARKILVNLIIVPFRAGKSAKMYQRIWTDKGSPILIHSVSLLEKLNQKKNPAKHYFLAMRYGEPSAEKVMEVLKSEHFKEIIVLPLFPQYASSTVGSVIAKCTEILDKWPIKSNIHFIKGFYNHPAFINLWANRIKSLDISNFDHILFVFHGLPFRQVEKMHPGHKCHELNCNSQVSEINKLCYYAQCHENSRLLAMASGIDNSGYAVCFQSRFGKKWLGPFADKTIEEKAMHGLKKLLVIPLSFVADCLETKLEIEIEYTHLFIKSGGEKLIMAESLNSDEDWVETLNQIIDI